MVKNLNNNASNEKSCVDCLTTTTPLWRGGPAGPRSLCNACGIRFRKKRRGVILSTKSPVQQVEQKHVIVKKRRSEAKKTTPIKDLVAGSLKLRIVLGSRRSKWCDQQMHHSGEEEQAAILLMALSSASV